MQHQNRPIRIALDHRAIGWGEGTGVARYRDNLARAVARFAEVEPVSDGDARSALRDLPRIVGGKASLSQDGEGWRADDLYRLAQRHFRLTGRLLRVESADAPGLVHWSHPMPIHWSGCPSICTVHDLIPMENPGLTGMSGLRQDRLLCRLIEAGTQFATVSETVRDALIARYGLDPSRVADCGQAATVGTPGALPEGLRPGGYFLVLGRVETRKNIERLLRAHRASGTDLPIVLAGPEGHWASEAERRRVEELAASPQVIRLGWQPDDAVAALLTHAHALLMPSLAEGFGLPAAEAMVAGVPVLAANRGAALEVTGDAALAVDPGDEAMIAAAIARLDRDAALRADLIERGRCQTSRFGIESFADRLHALYEGVMQRGIRASSCA